MRETVTIIFSEVITNYTREIIINCETINKVQQVHDCSKLIGTATLESRVIF